MQRRIVREAVRNAVPVPCKKAERPAVKMDEAAALVEVILEVHRKSPREAAPHIAPDLRVHPGRDPGPNPAERTVGQYVEGRKRLLGFSEYDIFFPASYEWGTEAQVD